MVDPFMLVEYGVDYQPIVDRLKAEGYDLWDPTKQLKRNLGKSSRIFFVWNTQLVYLRKSFSQQVTIRYVDPKATNYSFIEEALKHFNLA